LLCKIPKKSLIKKKGPSHYKKIRNSPSLVANFNCSNVSTTNLQPTQQYNQPIANFKQHPQQSMSFNNSLPVFQQIPRNSQQFLKNQQVYFYQGTQQSITQNQENYSVSEKNSGTHKMANKAFKRSRNEENKRIQHQQHVENNKKQGLLGSLNEREKCPICLESFEGNDPVKETGVCRHVYHASCLKKLLEHDNKCAVCRLVIVKKFGPSPNGNMTLEYSIDSLPGYYDCGMIIIHYIIPNGIQGSQHPNPGFPFCGTKRVSYLPNNEEGNNVLKLLQKAWEMKLTFRIGRSLTTGQTNVVTWNDIHHKTAISGGPYGYPDATYLQRVTADMNALGIKLDF